MGICNAIREKDGATGLINHQDIPSRIRAISTGSSALMLFEPEYINAVTLVNADEIVMIEEEAV